MKQHLHSNAKTTYKIRREIKHSKDSISSLARRYNLSWMTVKKWKDRDSIEDKSSIPNKLNTSLSRYEEDMILFERRVYKKTIDEIYVCLRARIPSLYPMKIYRVLRRYGLNVLPSEYVKEDRKCKEFNKYTIGYLHIDTVYTPKINKKRYYIFACIDRISKLAYIWLANRKNMNNGRKFLERVIGFYPYKINYILTDNGQEFSYNSLPKNKSTKKVHIFDKICIDNKIKHKTIVFRHPWTNGMVERFNRKLRDKVLRRYLFTDVCNLKDKLIEYINRYNKEICLKGLGYETPYSYLKNKFNISIQRTVT
jgi:transposase InsO family protein